MRYDINPKNNGFALLIVLVYIFTTVVIISGVSTSIISSIKVSSTYDASRQAMEAAEYGEVQALMQYCTSGETSLGLATWIQQNNLSEPAIKKTVQLPTFNDMGVQPQSIPTVHGSSYIALVTLLEEKTEHKPAGLIDKVLDALASAPLKTTTEQYRIVVIHAAGRSKNITRSIEAIYQIVDMENTEQARRITRMAWREIPAFTMAEKQ